MWASHRPSHLGELTPRGDSTLSTPPPMERDSPLSLVHVASAVEGSVTVDQFDEIVSSRRWDAVDAAASVTGSTRM